jgi:hypothetical protein
MRRKERQIDDPALARRPGDPETADRLSVEQDRLVLRAGESHPPVLPLRTELEINERRALLRRPIRDLRARRGVELAQEMLVRVGDRAPGDD